jgi:hypothetical protein
MRNEYLAVSSQYFDAWVDRAIVGKSTRVRVLRGPSGWLAYHGWLEVAGDRPLPE